MSKKSATSRSFALLRGFLLIFGAVEVSYQLRCLGVVLGYGMCVPVQSDGPIGVAHAVLDRLQVGAVCQQQRGLAVAKLVEAEFREASLRPEAAPPTLEVREVDLMVANLRGKYTDATTLVDDLISSYGRGAFDLVIIDPAYKVQPGSENDADAITRFCAELDRLVEGLDCTVAYSHHHSKGGQGGKNAQDRASGSGVFGRDADALIDMVELGINEDAFMAERLRGRRGAIPFRLEFVLRDFKSPEPLDIWFTHPIHVTDDTGTLGACEVRRPGKTRGGNRKRSEQIKTMIESALFDFMDGRDEVNRKEFVDFIKMDARTVNKHLKNSDAFEIVSGTSSATIKRIR